MEATTQTIKKTRLMKFAAHPPEVKVPMPQHKDPAVPNNKTSFIPEDEIQIIEKNLQTCISNQTQSYQQFLKNYFDLAQKILGVAPAFAGSEKSTLDCQTAVFDPQARVDLPRVISPYKMFSCEHVRAFSEGRAYDCFGPGFELTLTHTRTPSFHKSKWLLLGDITEFDVHGGPYKRGYMRSVYPIQPDDCFLTGDFNKDPRMLGTLMRDAGIQLTVFYMASCGLTLNKDGWRFDVIQDDTHKMHGLGQIMPTSKCIEHAIFVESFIIDEKPKIYVHLFSGVDGVQIFQTRLGVQLVPDWPLSNDDPRIRDYVEPKPVAQQDGFEFGYKSLLSAALGKPSNVFGDKFKIFNSHRRVARLPGPPYHFMSRILHLDTKVGEVKQKSTMVCEYDVPADAWYFTKNQAKTMPFAVLSEIALQPCGWFSCFTGFPLLIEEDLLFRNLDGKGTCFKEIKPDAGTLRTHVEFASYSRIENMVLVSYHVTCFSGNEKVYEMDTGFGFFPTSAFENQVGLPLLAYEAGLLEKPSEHQIDLTQKPAEFFSSTLRLADDMLLMIDRVTGFWPNGGSEGNGLLRAEKDVNPGEWFFKAHFFQDPVQPGSLGLEAMLQLLQFYMIEANLGKGIKNPRFEPLMLNKELTWKYRGQVVPTNHTIITVMNILETGQDDRGVYAIAEASLWVDGKRIYEAKNMGMRIVGLPGPKFSRHDLELLASGKISKVFGSLFKKQDQYAIQVRMPEPPLLLADRITGIDAKPGVLGKGTLWSETDITEDAWYLHHDRMSLGIMIESGQADLLLISWMGIDFVNQGERAYRLLGCDLTLHGEAPKIGDTLCYEIHIDGHAKSGDVRLFFFHYDCYIAGELRLSVRNCQAGFFTKKELAGSEGVIWDVHTAEYDRDARVDSPTVVSPHRSFSREHVRAFSEGRAYDCFGSGFEYSLSHTRTPCIQPGDMQLLDEITNFDVQGGPWKRGYMRGVQKISPKDWFFKGHFKNDPCMPGTLMLDAGIQLTAFYMAACGLTLNKDGWRFEVIQNETYEMRCRGQVIPSSQCVEYEIFVESLIIDDMPKIYVQLLSCVDGLKAFQTRLGVQLVPDWPLSDYDPRIRDYVEPKPVAQQNGFEFGYKSLLSAAIGRPSNVFGSQFKMFDNHRHAPRLPGPPYLFISRVLQLDSKVAEITPKASMVSEYDVPADAWYFTENQAQTIPLSFLLEIALQPSGWFSCYMGFPLLVEDDLFFRNIDGKGIFFKEVKPNSGTLRIHTTFTSYSCIEKMTLVSYHIIGFMGDEKFFEMDGGSGFFPRAALENQQGLPPFAYEKNIVEKPSEYQIDLSKKPAKFFSSTLRLANDKLLMIDRVTGFWPDGGSAGKGLLRAEKDVNPGDWFFKAHFFHDPVQPGSLGLEGMLQLLQLYMIETELGKGIKNPRFEPLMLNNELIWKYRGQIVPSDKLLTTIVNVLETGRDKRGVYAIAEASLWVDGQRINEAKNMGLRIVDMGS